MDIYGGEIPLFIIMENSDICKYSIALDMGYSYKNGLISGKGRTDNSFLIYLGVFKITNIWTLGDKDKPPTMESVAYPIAALEYVEDECNTLIFNEYPEEFVKEISEGLKKLGTIQCDNCIHLHKRNLLKHNCSEKFIKNKCNE